MTAVLPLLAESGRVIGMSWEGSDDPVWDAERLRTAADAAGVGLWSWNVDTDEIALDERSHGLWGVPRDGPYTFADLSARIVPPDRDRVRAAFAATRAAPGPYQIDFRIARDGEAVRWVSARGRGGDEGIVGRTMFGVFLDSTARKEAEETRDLLAHEMSHRVKNLFAIASSLTSIAARSAATTTEMARDLTQRLATLGRAHDLIRPMPGDGGGEAALLGDIFSVLLAPYDDRGMVGDRIRVSLPDARVGERAATTLALVVHELATNSVKYGALSVAGGTLDVSCTQHDGEVAVVWTERGGPPVSAPTGPGGFGSKLVAMSLGQQLGGAIAYDWPPEGAVVTLRMSRARLAA
jgi:two-component sensor histidine kinase